MHAAAVATYTHRGPQTARRATNERNQLCGIICPHRPPPHIDPTHSPSTQPIQRTTSRPRLGRRSPSPRAASSDCTTSRCTRTPPRGLPPSSRASCSSTFLRGIIPRQVRRHRPPLQVVDEDGNEDATPLPLHTTRTPSSLEGRRWLQGSDRVHSSHSRGLRKCRLVSVACFQSSGHPDSLLLSGSHGCSTNTACDHQSGSLSRNTISSTKVRP